MTPVAGIQLQRAVHLHLQVVAAVPFVWGLS